MSGKFKTTSSSLYTNNNVREDIPKWLESVSEVEIKPINKIDLDISSPKGIFAEKNTVNRDESSGELRYAQGMKISSNRMVIDSKIQLAKFLLGKYYKTEASINENEVQLLTKLDGVAADFIFRFNKNGNKVASNNTFLINLNDDILEYPFNKSGLEECIKDIKNNKTVTSKKVESIGKASLINKEEIIRRFNGGLRQATDKINELVKSGEIIGVGSNTFASYYDMDYLFPSMEKEALEAPMSAFDFAPNIEHVSTKQHKNEESFIIDTNKILKSIFVDHKLINLNRLNNTLNVNAQVLDVNGITHEAGFKFNINNEKISDINSVHYKNKDFTLDEFSTNINNVNELVKNSNSNLKKINDQKIYTKKNMSEKLAHLISSSSINDVIDSWVDLKLLNPINSELFASKKSFSELLDNINVEKLNDDEISNIAQYSKKFGEKLNVDRIGTIKEYNLDAEEIKNYSKKFGENLNFNRVEMENTGSREVEDTINSENLLFKCDKYISTHIKKYSSIDFKNNDNKANYTIKIFNENLGLNNIVNLVLDYNDKKITGCYADYNGEKISIEKIGNVFATSELLKNHLNYNFNKKNDSGIIISKDKLKQKLLKISSVKDEEIEQLINNWEKNNKITKINSREFTSKHTFEELLNMSNIKSLTEEEMKIEFKKQQRNKIATIQTGQYNIADQDNRILEAKTQDLSPKMIELKDKIKNTIDKALNNKIITSNKHSNLNILLSEAKSERDLDNVWKDFSKYIN